MEEEEDREDAPPVDEEEDREDAPPVDEEEEEDEETDCPVTVTLNEVDTAGSRMAFWYDRVTVYTPLDVMGWHVM